MGSDSVEQLAEVGTVVDGPFVSNRVVETWWWERPNNCGDLGSNRADLLLRCQRIWGGRIKVIRMVEHSTTTVHIVSLPACLSCGWVEGHDEGCGR